MTALVDSGHVSPEELLLQQLPHHRSTLHIRAFGREPNALPILCYHLMPKKLWLPFVDTYRTFCLGPGPQGKEVLQGIQRLALPEGISIG